MIARSVWSRALRLHPLWHRGWQRHCRHECEAHRVIGGVGCVHQASAVHRIADTERWLKRVVIGERLCPFAPPLRDQDQLMLRAPTAVTEDEVIAEVAREAAALADMPGDKWRTTLVVFDSESWSSWNGLVSLSWRIQSEAIFDQGLSEQIQLVLFHPEAVHNSYGEGPPDAASYTIRAPHPTVQLLRECDILGAVRRYPRADEIPGLNRARLREQGVDACRDRLAQCYSQRQPSSHAHLEANESMAAVVGEGGPGTPHGPGQA